MLFSFTSVALFLGSLAPTAVLAAPTVHEDLGVFADIQGRASTCNTPTNRACWTSGFNISTDYEASTPTTGVVRKVSNVL